MDELLKSFNLKYDDLNAAEKETLQTMLSNMQHDVLTIEKLKDYINNMRDAVEEELTRSDIGTKQDLFLKARLRNYRLLAAFLQTPEKAKKQLEQALKGIK